MEGKGDFINPLHSLFTDEVLAAHMKHDAVIAILSVGLVMAIIIAVVLLCRRRKGKTSLSDIMYIIIFRICGSI